MLPRVAVLHLGVRTTCPHEFVEGYSILVVPEFLQGFKSVCLCWSLTNWDIFLIDWRLWPTFLAKAKVAALSFQMGFDLNEPPIKIVGFNVGEVVLCGGVGAVYHAFVEKLVWI
jgi:hypothetical protein